MNDSAGSIQESLGLRRNPPGNRSQGQRRFAYNLDASSTQPLWRAKQYSRGRIHHGSLLVRTLPHASHPSQRNLDWLVSNNQQRSPADWIQIGIVRFQGFTAHKQAGKIGRSMNMQPETSLRSTGEPPQ
jgi:hypothetical protein